MKKILLLLLVVSMLVFAFTGCVKNGGSGSNGESGGESGGETGGETGGEEGGETGGEEGGDEGEEIPPPDEGGWTNPDFN